MSDRDSNEVVRLGPCANCGYKPWEHEIEESGGRCPECGWHAGTD